MDVSSISSTSGAMSLLSSGIQKDNIQTQIAVSVVKQIQNTQTSQGQAIVNMIQDLGKIIDRSA
jgi:hypothetical protein